MGLKHCQCWACRAGRKRTSNKVRIERCKRQLKLRGRNDLRKGKDIVTDRVSVPYTD